MEIKLARTAGFCMGVRRAVDIVLEIAQHETSRRIYTYGPLIHNPQTIELLKNRGVNPIENIEEIQDRENAILIIRAHGIAPAERKKWKLNSPRPRAFAWVSAGPWILYWKLRSMKPAVVSILTVL